ncbi:hypothetical protein Dsin_002918 [Dipteronia sinensis]|uniref:Uncharacterized protein n=1 Tax=Dipteronia sinensis TaxID=43782 RepID=A0AAE0EKF6_9ROSI|nr:hypothetical protein Dsin_002918 [Dipteronia sinensis]
MVLSSEPGIPEPYLYKRPSKTFTTNHKHISNMAYKQNSSILYPLLLTALLLISGNEALASRRLLDTTHPTVPELPKPELPHLPTIPTLPLPKVELPPLPKPELPALPHAPTLAKPELPPLPKPELPKMPELPALPHLLDLPKPTLPTIPSLPKDLPIPSFFPPHSTTSP